MVGLDRDLLVLARQGADDQRRAGFVDQDAVGLVDQDEVRVAAARAVSPPPPASCPACRREVGLPFADAPQQQPVAEEVEAELLGRAVGDVAGVGLARARAAASAISITPTVMPSARRSAASSRRRGGPDSR